MQKGVLSDREQQRNPRVKRWIYPFVILLCMALISGVIQSLKKAPELKQAIDNTPYVDVEALSPGQLPLYLSSQGFVEPRYKTMLSAQVTGEVIRISPTFEAGGFVSKGDVLVEVDPSNYLTKVNDAQATLAGAIASLELEHAQAKVAKSEWKSVSSSAPDLGLRKPQLAQARARVKAAEALLQQAEKDLSRTKIIAPYDGIIINRQVSIGSIVSLGTLLGEVWDTSVARIRLPISPEDEDLIQPPVGADVILSKIKNTSAHAEVESIDDMRTLQPEWHATVVRHEGVIERGSRMVYLVAELEDPYRRKGSEAHPLPFGEFLHAQIFAQTLSNAVRVPRYVIREGKVPIVENDTLRFKAVDIFRHETNSTILVGGIKDQDLLVTTALDYPVDGMKVTIGSASLPDVPNEESSSDANE